MKRARRHRKENRAHSDTAAGLGAEPEFVPVIIVACFLQRRKVAQTVLSPELPRPFETTLASAARRFHGAAADGPAAISNFLVVHSSRLTGKILLLLAHRLAGGAAPREESGNLLQHGLFLPVTQLVSA